MTQKTVYPTPQEALIEFARSIAPRPSQERQQALHTYIQGLTLAHDSAQKLATAWRIEGSLLGDGMPEEDGTDRRDAHPGLRRFVSGRKKVSVRAATLAAIYVHGPQAPKQIVAVLEGAGYRAGKGKFGDNVRSALWHAREAGTLIDKDGKNAFASDEAREAFAKEEGLPIG